MRITGGTWRGRSLSAPGKTKGIRPTADRTREALFSILISDGWEAEGARVLDLFAGTGALGLEALSRGAAHATFVESASAARALLARNIAQFPEADTRILPKDATRLGPCPGAPFHVIFADPPYGKSLAEAALSALLSGNWIAPGARLVIEENTEIPWPNGLTPTGSRRYGDTTLNFARHP